MKKDKYITAFCFKCGDMVQVQRLWLQDPVVLCYDCGMDKAGY